MNRDDIRKLLEEEDESCSDLEDFSSGSSDSFVPSENYKSDSSSAEDLDNDNINEDIGDINEIDTNTLDCDQPHDENFDWKSPEEFVPKRTASTSRNCKISSDIPRTASIGDIFQKLIPKSVYMYIAQCTNERIQILESEQSARKKPKLTRTNAGEIKVIVGCMFIMCYNRLPCVKDYWSLHKSLGNKSIQEAIARDRFLFITSKMYFACPEKPLDCSKTYYLDDLVECLKKTFQKCRQDSSFQSIDESMTKFKGRSSLKQCMPLKPVKRGIKMWLRCDALTGYTYDFNIYCGKDLEEHSGTLGERVVTKLISSVAENDVTLCFDRFFTSVNLLNTLAYPAVGTIMRNRKNVPEFTSKKLERGEAEFKSTSSGLLCVKWQDTKEVLVISNCHEPGMTFVTKTLKTGEKIQVPCPNAIQFYRQIMGGVDLADQMSGLYEYDRKSDKWWKKVFYRFLMMAAVNAWIIYNELRREKMPFKSFLVTLAETLIDEGSKVTAVPRSVRPGPVRRVTGQKHLPIEGDTRRRCISCSKQKKQTRTKTICKECQVPLCKFCFASFHT